MGGNHISILMAPAFHQLIDESMHFVARGIAAYFSLQTIETFPGQRVSHLA